MFAGKSNEKTPGPLREPGVFCIQGPKQPFHFLPSADLRAANLCLRTACCRACLRATGLCRLRTACRRTCLRATGLTSLRSSLRTTRRRTCLWATGLLSLRTCLRTASLRSALRPETKSEASLRHHAETEAALTAPALSAAPRLLTSALRSRTKAEALTAPALSAASRLLTSALRCNSEPLRSALCASAEADLLRSALEHSGLSSAEVCLSIHDSGCSDPGEKDPGNCECKNLVHSSLLDYVVCGSYSYFIGFTSRIFKNASFPPIQRPASKKISF